MLDQEPTFWTNLDKSKHLNDINCMKYCIDIKHRKKKQLIIFTCYLCSRYVKFMLLNQEFSFDVDVSNLPCGLNGALYLVEMDADGGMSFSTNECGAQYGTGYCDAQCPHDMKWINGEANCEEWNPSDNDVNAGTGHYGTCCAEMDLWEANSMAQSFTTHPCEIEGQYRCEGTECGDNASDERLVS